MAAMAYDGLLVAGLLMVAAALVVIPVGGGIESGNHLFQLYLLVVAWVYFAVSWRHGGQTLGMKAWRIQLTADGGKPSWMQTAIRFAVALVSALCLGLGFFWSLLHPQKATWHDLASHTRLTVRPSSRGRGSGVRG